jgi:hypothetical protein
MYRVISLKRRLKRETQVEMPLACKNTSTTVLGYAITKNSFYSTANGVVFSLNIHGVQVNGYTKLTIMALSSKIYLLKVFKRMNLNWQ